MPQVHFVKKARKDQPGGIKAGDSYFWWKFRRGGKHYSKTHPRPSQLTQSEYLSTALAFQEQVENLNIDPSDPQAAADELRSVAEEIRNLGEEQDGKIDNMPESLQSSETADLLRGRAEACESLADELETAASEIDGLEEEITVEEEEEIEDNADGDKESPDDSLVTRIEDILGGISWNFEP